MYVWVALSVEVWCGPGDRDSDVDVDIFGVVVGVGCDVWVETIELIAGRSIDVEVDILCIIVDEGPQVTSIFIVYDSNVSTVSNHHS